MVEKTAMCEVATCHNVCHILDPSGLVLESTERERMYPSSSKKYVLLINS
jgi:hypothetical protein